MDNVIQSGTHQRPPSTDVRHKCLVRTLHRRLGGRRSNRMKRFSDWPARARTVCALSKGGGPMVSSGMTRRAMISGSLSAVAAMGMPFPALAQGAGRTDEAATRYGRVRGKREDGIVKFLGVPYATPPLGEL